MLKILENNRVSGSEIYKVVESKDKNYSRWISRAIDYADLIKDKDFFPKMEKSTGGRPFTDYEFNLDAAKEICLLEKNEKGKQVRKWLIEISKQVENKDLLNETEILTLSALIGFFKFVENQKDITKRHMTDYVNQHPSKYAFAEFHTLRNNILQISKEEIELKLKEYCIEQNKRLPALKSNRDKIMFIDMYDSLKNAVWDFLYMNGSPTALKLSELAKKMAKAQGISILPKNENNLFQIREMLPQLPII
jgi:phage anti-repressor protein